MQEKKYVIKKSILGNPRHINCTWLGFHIDQNKDRIKISLEISFVLRKPGLIFGLPLHYRLTSHTPNKMTPPPISDTNVTGSPNTKNATTTATNGSM